MRLGFYETCFLSGQFALPLSGAGLTFFARGFTLALEVGCFFTPFDALGLLWNLLSFRSISSAPVRGGTHFLCCCKESKQRKQLPTASANNPSLALMGLALESKCRPHGRTRLGSRTHCVNSQYTRQVQQSYIRPRATRSDVGCTAQGTRQRGKRKDKMGFSEPNVGAKRGRSQTECIPLRGSARCHSGSASQAPFHREGDTYSPAPIRY